MKIALITLLIWLVLVAFGYVMPAHGYDGDNPYQIMEDLLDSYSYMSYAVFEEPFDFHKYSGYELQRNLGCEKLDMLTKIDLTPKKCEGIFLLYRGLSE